jgi:3-deoxy-manno-octulosonate cytidylyltransferase (CMP-KDO synthetase)
MIWHVYQRALRARLLDMVAVATDDQRIYHCIRDGGGFAVMTSGRHATGTDRIAEALEKIGIQKSKFEIVVNIQGDEPLVEPRAIDAVVHRLRRDRTADLATAVCPLPRPEEAADPNIVKAVLDRRGRAIYFSRSPIPYHRHLLAGRYLFYKHIGIYAYRRDFLKRFCRWRRGPLERTESLEQLRALENGAAIAAAIIPRGWPAVDTPGDLIRVRRLMAAGKHINKPI